MEETSWEKYENDEDTIIKYKEILEPTKVNIKNFDKIGKFD